MKTAGVKIFWQQTFYHRFTGRIRIIEPDGTAYYLPSWALEEQHLVSDFKTPCWNKDRKVEGDTRAKAIRRMQRYDKRMNFPKAELIGEL